jgi:hypothetical protein
MEDCAEQETPTHWMPHGSIGPFISQLCGNDGVSFHANKICCKAATAIKHIQHSQDGVKSCQVLEEFGFTIAQSTKPSFMHHDLEEKKQSSRTQHTCLMKHVATSHAVNHEQYKVCLSYPTLTIRLMCRCCNPNIIWELKQTGDGEQENYKEA